jgi:hypothetical protein
MSKIFRVLKKTINSEPAVDNDGRLNKADLSKLYKLRPEGIRRCAMIELLVRLAIDYFPGCSIEDSVYKYLNNVFPKLKPDKFEDMPSMKEHKFIGIDAYRARFLLTPQIDMILEANKPIMEVVSKDFVLFYLLVVQKT